jgi:hypothetical protein
VVCKSLKRRNLPIKTYATATENL